MPDEKLSTAKAVVVEALDKGGELPGTEIMSWIRTRIPGFKPADVGFVNLRSLIGSIPAVIETGRKGGDFLYAKADSGRAPASPAAPLPRTPKLGDADVIRTFSSPRKIYRLFANPQSGELIAQNANLGSPSGFVEIEPLSAAEHREIIDDFLCSLSDSDQATLRLCVDSSKNWWWKFFIAVKNLGLQQQLSTLRERRIFEKLRARLSAVGAPLASLDKAVVHTGGLRSGVSLAPKLTASATPDRTREVAIRLVQRAHESELRSLKFRLGDVLDALQLD